MPSTIYTQHTPEMYGAGSGLIWLGDAYTYEQVTSRWPNVKWSYLYSGYTNLGKVSDYSMIRVQSGMQNYWNTYSGMYKSQCYWTSEFYVSGNCGSHVYPSFFNDTETRVRGVRIYYSGTYGVNLAPGNTFYNGYANPAYVVAPVTYQITPVIREVPYNGSYTNDTGSTVSVYYRGTWAVSEGNEDLYSNAMPAMLMGTASGFSEGIGVVETCHTYSGAPEDAWKEWTQDEAAIMEAYERTVGPNDALYSSSGNAWGGSVAAPKKFTITPGHYSVSFGHIWFHTSCDIDGQGARFKAYRGNFRNMGTSPTWRSPTGNQAKALITIGADRYVNYDRLGPLRVGDSRPAPGFKDCNVFFPHLTSANSVYSEHIGDIDGAGIRFLGVYTCNFYNVNMYDNVRYGIIFSADDLGMSYNEYHLGKIYGSILVALKWRLRDGSNNQAWFNNSKFIGGHISAGTSRCIGLWDPDTAPTVLLDNDNSLENPNRDPREDIYMGLVPEGAGAYQFGHHIPTFWADNVSTETGGFLYFIRASGWCNINWNKGRFEGMEEAIWHKGRSEWIPRREWWLTGNVYRNVFIDTVSNGALDGLPQKYIGKGIDYVQYNNPLPGNNYLGAYTQYQRVRTVGEAGLNNSTYCISQDLYIGGSEGKIIMPSKDKEKCRALYIDTIVDPVSSKEYPVAKVKNIPYVWIKWKAASEPDSYYSTDHRTFPVGTKVRFKFGDFESIPQNSFYNTYLGTTSRAVINAPLIKSYHQFWPTTSSSDTYIGIYPSGIIDGETGTRTLDPGQTLYAGAWAYWNPNVVNDSYVEADYTFTESGICRPRLYMGGYLTNGGRFFRFDANYHLHSIIIADPGDNWEPEPSEEYEPSMILGGGEPEDITPEEYEELTRPIEEHQNNTLVDEE